MKLSIYKSYDDLPLFLNARTVANVLGVSISSQVVSDTNLLAVSRRSETAFLIASRTNGSPLA